MSLYYGVFNQKSAMDKGDYVEIAAENFGIAMEVMRREHHGHWSFMLDEEEFKQYKLKHPEAKKHGGTLS